MKVIVNLAVVLVAGAAALSCITDTPEGTDEPGLAPQVELICRQANDCNTLWSGDQASCQSYLLPCLDNLTPEQRATWAQQIDSCARAAAGCGATFDCYAKVPWC